MTTAVLAQAPRQSAILAAVALLHVAILIVVANDRVTGPRVVMLPPPLYVLPNPSEPLKRAVPVLPEPGEYSPEPVAQPALVLPSIREEVAPIETFAGDADGTASSVIGSPVGHYRPPTLDMRDSRLSALIDTCYPSSARRLGNEGRAQVDIVIDAEGRAASWSLLAGTGYLRHDAAVDCVVGRLRFQPARRDGRAVAAEVRQSIVFRLN